MPSKPMSGSAIVKARTKWELSQEELAELWEMPRTQLSRLENSDTIRNAWKMLTKVLDEWGPKAFEGL